MHLTLPDTAYNRPSTVLWDLQILTHLFLTSTLWWWYNPCFKNKETEVERLMFDLISGRTRIPIHVSGFQFTYLLKPYWVDVKRRTFSGTHCFLYQLEVCLSLFLVLHFQIHFILFRTYSLISCHVSSFLMTLVFLFSDDYSIPSPTSFLFIRFFPCSLECSNSPFSS